MLRAGGFALWLQRLLTLLAKYPHPSKYHKLRLNWYWPCYWAKIKRQRLTNTNTALYCTALYWIVLYSNTFLTFHCMMHCTVQCTTPLVRPQPRDTERWQPPLGCRNAIKIWIWSTLGKTIPKTICAKMQNHFFCKCNEQNQNYPLSRKVFTTLLGQAWSCLTVPVRPYRLELGRY